MCMNAKRGSLNTPDGKKRKKKKRKTILFPPIERASLGVNECSAFIHHSSGRREGTSFKPPEQFCLQGSGIIRQPWQWSILKKQNTPKTSMALTEGFHLRYPFPGVQWVYHALREVMALIDSQ